ncbi:MAG TPA: dihydrofolate reductase family protein [Mycobacterium sp.]|nr:dihydrofolate reductase family protein [Mycobacterium sp.]
MFGVCAHTVRGPIGTSPPIGRHIILTGSIRLAHTLIAANVVDEYRVPVYPAVQGRGRRLFPDGTAIGHRRLVEPAKSFRSGITLLRHATRCVVCSAGQQGIRPSC